MQSLLFIYLRSNLFIQAFLLPFAAPTHQNPGNSLKVT